MKKFNIRYLATGGQVAAGYVVLTFISSAFGLSSGAVQLRLSEALCALPCFVPASVPGLFVGCLIANLLTGALPQDIIFGSLATLAGALGTRLLRKNYTIALLAPVIANTLVVPPVLIHVYGVDMMPWLVYLTVFAGEALSVLVPGLLFKKRLTVFFDNRHW